MRVLLPQRRRWRRRRRDVDGDVAAWPAAIGADDAEALALIVDEELLPLVHTIGHNHLNRQCLGEWPRRRRRRRDVDGDVAARPAAIGADDAEALALVVDEEFLPLVHAIGHDDLHRQRLHQGRAERKTAEVGRVPFRFRWPLDRSRDLSRSKNRQVQPADRGEH